MERLSHVDKHGKASMVDVSEKPKIRRTAIAKGALRCNPKTIELIEANSLAKGDVLGVARVAGISGGKITSQLIPLCHNIMIDAIGVEFTLLPDKVEIVATAKCTDKTGIEMEALTAVSLAALTVYDMCKAVDTSMVIEDIHLVEKRKEELNG